MRQRRRSAADAAPARLSLQTGMRGAFGKPHGTVARVDIGQELISVRTKDASKAHVVEALRRAKFKLPGQQKILVTNRWGFTNLVRSEYEARRAAGEIVPDGAHCKFPTNHGPLDEWRKRIAASV